MGAPSLAIAAGNPLNAEAAANVARAGGNAVDACLASAIMAWVAEPFFASVGGGGFVIVRSPEGKVEAIDGNNAMPLTAPTEPGQGLKPIFVPDYSDGLNTGIGGGSVAVPGVLAAFRRAWERHGRIEWAALFEDAIKAARDGISFPRTSAYYLSVTWDTIWSAYPAPRSIFSTDGRPLREGEKLVQSELADSLEAIARTGPGIFYGGELGKDIAGEIGADGGFLTAGDLAPYEPAVRLPISTTAFGWRVESNPPPAVGGAVLTHMLAILDGADLDNPAARLQAIVEAQRAAVGYRTERYQDPGEIAGALEEVLARLRGRTPGAAETTHTSTADADGYVCSLTESNGYGSGLVVRGVLLNNALGEEELNPLGVHRLPPGSRCHSNQAPTVATGPDQVVGLGSPGANRIVTAIAQTLIGLAIDGRSLEEAVAAPRAHLDARPQGETLCYEPGLPGDELPYIPRPYDELHMYFGGVNVASVRSDGSVDAAFDPRRSGGCILV
jgi:gamma-glutamyltranspeptidase / glutathione hydrolase